MAYVLENDVLKLECVENGGEMQHLIKKATNQEYLYQGDQGWSGKNPSLFPLVGNTYTKDYEIDGKSYAMKNHGLIRYATLKGEQKSDAIVFRLDADDASLKQYPFHFHYEIEYRLNGNKVEIKYTIQNNDEKPMPFSFGLHPGFKVPESAEEKFEDYSLVYEKEEHCTQYVFDPSFAKNVEYVPVTFKEWKLSREDIAEYATLVYKDLKSDYVTLAYKGEDRLRVSLTGFPFLAIWTHSSKSDFLCIEPWFGHADFEKETPDFYHREGTIVLESNASWSCSYWIEIC